MSHLSASELEGVLSKFEQGPVAFDFETCGTDATDPTNSVRSVGLANADHCLAIDLLPGQTVTVCEWLLNQQVIAHNYVFDGSWIRRYAGSAPTAWFDTYGMFRQLASEGWLGQTWGLKTAMVEILGWDEPNDLPLAAHLKSRGLRKAQMGQADWEFLGEYNALDAGATWLLYEYFCSVLASHDWGELLMNYHQIEHCGEIDLLIRQQFNGMTLDVPKLRVYAEGLSGKIRGLERDFCQVPEIAEALQYSWQWNEKVMLTTAPEMYKKNGHVSKNWLAWLAKYGEADEAGIWKFALTRLKNKKTGEVKEKKNWKPFNINSAPDLRTLFYRMLGYEPTAFTPNKEHPELKGVAKTDTKALPYLGEGGVVLNTYRTLRDELKFVTSALALQRGGIFNPKLKSIATVTGRLGGGSEEIDGTKHKLNIQQLPKRRGFLECFIARQGCKLVYTDFSALEMKVAALASRDKNLYHLYGPKANPNHDVYLFNGAQIPKFREAITELYDLDNPTAAGKKAAKAKFADIRQDIFKPWVLGSIYGLGAGTMYENYKLAKVEGMTFEFCQELGATFRSTYAGLGRLQRRLKAQWKKNGGWFLNLRGRPMCVHRDIDPKLCKMKDIVNRACQSYGHDCLMMYLQFLQRRIVGKAEPYMVDTHDSTVWEVPDEHVEFVVEQFKLAYDDLNAALGHDIPFDGDFKIASNLADIMCED